MFVWTSVHDQSFSALKIALTSALVLALPDFSKPFVIETDASGMGVGAVLMQQGHPLAFLSKSLSPRLQGLSTYEKEYLAILMAVEQWHSYLQLAEFQILTDHKSLVHLEEQRLHTPWRSKKFSLGYWVCSTRSYTGRGQITELRMRCLDFHQCSVMQ
jgi:hypothetical protein